jgi:hypothetical protein
LFGDALTTVCVSYIHAFEFTEISEELDSTASNSVVIGTHHKKRYLLGNEFFDAEAMAAFWWIISLKDVV